jgi:hypothetical protein
MTDTNTVPMLLERRSPQLDQWFLEKCSSLAAMVAAQMQRLGITLAAMGVLIAAHAPAG